MIIEFSVSNFRSFDGEQSLSFVASPDRSHEQTHCVGTQWRAASRVLRSAVLFGPNASGKSNMLAALRTLRELILRSSIQSVDGLSAWHTPFYSQRDKAAPTVFKIDLLLEGVRYRYHLSHNGAQILHEELRVNLNHKSQRWFARHFDAASGTEIWETFSAGMHGPREAWRKATGPTALFLTTAARLNASQLAPLMHWFEHQLDVSLSSASPVQIATAASLNKPRFKARAVEVLRAADFAVIDIRVKDEGTPSKRGAPAGVELLCERHGLQPAWLGAEEYSSGAKRLVNLLVPVLDGIDNDRLVVIDEFDVYLHPLVAKLLMRIINSPSNAGRGVQFLLVSHTTALMDLEIMRRDELWLMQMDTRDASHLRSLKEFSPRRHERIGRGYLEGRYGALPSVAMPSSW